MQILSQRIKSKAPNCKGICCLVHRVEWPQWKNFRQIVEDLRCHSHSMMWSAIISSQFQESNTLRALHDLAQWESLGGHKVLEWSLEAEFVSLSPQWLQIMANQRRTLSQRIVSKAPYCTGIYCLVHRVEWLQWKKFLQIVEDSRCHSHLMMRSATTLSHHQKSNTQRALQFQAQSLLLANHSFLE